MQARTTQESSKVYKSRTIQAGAYTYPNGDDYTICCWHCCSVIGTMTGGSILAAILRTSGRGGVLCPECRSKWCDCCGTVWDYRIEAIQLKPDDIPVRICNACLL